MKYRIALGIFTSLSLLTMQLTAQSPAKAEPSQQWFKDITTEQNPALWLKNHRQELSENPKAVKTLSRELLAESLRYSPQVLPRAKSALEALRKVYPQTKIAEALSPWPWSKGPLVDLVKNYKALHQNNDVHLVRQQLNLCYSQSIYTCQADMLYLLGRNTQLIQEDRKASFSKGASIAKSIDNQPLQLLNQVGHSVFADRSYHSKEQLASLKALIKQAKDLQFKEIEAVATLYMANHLSKHRGAKYNEIIELLETARQNFKGPDFQIDLLTAQADIDKNYGNRAKARASWVNILALLPTSKTQQRIDILQNLIESYSQMRNRSSSAAYNRNKDRYLLQMQSARPYIEELLTYYPVKSKDYFKLQTQHVEILLLAGNKNAKVQQEQFKNQLLEMPQTIYWKEQARFAVLLVNLGQIQEGREILSNLLSSPDLNEHQQACILKEIKNILPQDVARWGLKFMKADTLELREASVDVLNRLKPTDLIPEIKALLQSKDARVRNNAVQVLWYTAGKAAIPDLLPLLQDSNAGVRENVLEALVKANHPMPFEALKNELLSKNHTSRYKAFKLLEKHPQGKQKIIALALETNHPLQKHAISSLSNLKLSVQESQQFLPFLFSSDRNLRSKFRWLLQRSKYSDLWQPLIKLMNKQPHLTHEAVVVLGQWKVPEALNTLKPWAKQNDQKKIAYAYLFAKTPAEGKVQQALIPLLNPNEKASVRTAATLAMLSSKNKAAWQNFAAFFEHANLGKPFFQQTVNYQQEILNEMGPPCLPTSALKTASVWAGSSPNQFHVLKNWWLKAPILLWNGSYCMEPHLFTSTEKKRIKAQIEPLISQSENYSVRRKAKRYLKALKK